jgi:hypothetical protein
VVAIRLPRLDIKYSLPLSWTVLSKFPKLLEIRLDQNDMEVCKVGILPAVAESYIYFSVSHHFLISMCYFAVIAFNLKKTN